MNPDTYATRYVTLAGIGGADLALATPAEYEAAGRSEQLVAADAIASAAAGALDRLRAVAAVSEWTAELHARTVADMEALLTGTPAP